MVALESLYLFFCDEEARGGSTEALQITTTIGHDATISDRSQSWSKEKPKVNERHNVPAKRVLRPDLNIPSHMLDAFSGRTLSCIPLTQLPPNPEINISSNPSERVCTTKNYPPHDPGTYLVDRNVLRPGSQCPTPSIGQEE